MAKSKNVKNVPIVSSNKQIQEFTLRALIIGLVMCVVLGAANAYLGLKAGMTIAATYPAVVIGMAILKTFKGTILEENFARTLGSTGEALAAGAIFTIPAFVILNIWKFTSENLWQEYLVATSLMLIGGILGILFMIILRKMMVHDQSLPFPESVAAAEIHKAGQSGAKGAKILFNSMIVGAIIKLMDGLGLFKASNEFQFAVGKLKESFVKLGITQDSEKIATGGLTTFAAPAATPAYLGVGYIIGPELASLNFAGGLLAWGLFVPLLVYFIGPTLIDKYMITTGSSEQAWNLITNHLYRYIVRPIAIGGMLVGACYTLWKMRKNLIAGLKRSLDDVKQTGSDKSNDTPRTEKDISLKIILPALLILFSAMIGLYFYFTHMILAAIISAVVMIITGFFFSAVAANLVGMIGSSNNPISGLTLATTIIAALLMVIIGISGITGIVAVLGVAAIVCVACGVAGDMMQDFKVGHIVGGTPYKMQAGNLIAVIVSALVMFFPIYILHNSDLAANPATGGFGGPNLPAPQAGLMAALSQGIVAGEMAWPLVIVGMALGVSLIMVKIKSPMLFAVGMYLPLETTFAIFIGGIVRGFVDRRANKLNYSSEKKSVLENIGILSSSGLIAGEALMGLFIATVVFFRDKIYGIAKFWQIDINQNILEWLVLPVFAFMIFYLIYYPLSKAKEKI